MDSFSSDQQQTLPINLMNNPQNNNNNSINETAVSIQHQLHQLQLQDQNNYAQQSLKQFYNSYLKIHADMRFLQLQSIKKIFTHPIHAIYPPQPLVYFLPYTILIPVQSSLHTIRDNIKKYFDNDINNNTIKLNMYIDNKQQLFLSIHSASQLVYYKIKKVNLDKESHQMADCLDKQVLVDRLFNFYKVTYDKFYFQQVSVFIFYWAYVKGFLNQNYFSPSAIKMIAIWMFLDLGYGIENVLNNYEKKFWPAQSNCLQMSKTNRKGQCTIDKQILKYKNYSLEQKRGLYIISQKKYQLIKCIQPVLYPLGQRDQKRPYIFNYTKQQMQYFKQSANRAHKKLSQRSRAPSRYQLLFTIIKNLHKYFNNPNKLTFDIKRPKIIFQESSNQFLLDIQHPVFNYCLSKGLIENGSACRRIKSELGQLVRKVKDNVQAVENVVDLFRRK